VDTGAEMSADGVHRVTVILTYSTDVNFRLAPLAIESSAHACAIVYHKRTVAGPVANVLVARRAVLAWITGALIHVDVAVASTHKICGHMHTTGCSVVLNDVSVRTISIRVSVEASAGIGIDGYQYVSGSG